MPPSYNSTLAWRPSCPVGATELVQAKHAPPDAATLAAALESTTHRTGEQPVGSSKDLVSSHRINAMTQKKGIKRGWGALRTLQN